MPGMLSPCWEEVTDISAGGGEQHPRPVAAGHALQDVPGEHRSAAAAARAAGMDVLGFDVVNEPPAVGAAHPQIHAVAQKEIGQYLMSPTVTQQGESIPGICHAVALETEVY